MSPLSCQGCVATDPSVLFALFSLLLFFQVLTSLGLAQGWAMQQPDIVRPPLTIAQYIFLCAMVDRQGKLPSDHIAFKMEQHFTRVGRPELALKGRRVKEFVSRYIGMKKNAKLTQLAKKATSLLEEHSGSIEEAMAAARDEETLDDASDDDDDDDGGHADDAAADDADDDGDREDAPLPRTGFQHLASAPAMPILPIGMRLSFYAEDAWRCCVIKAHMPADAGMRYKLSTDHLKLYENIRLRAADHGPKKVWVAWRPDGGLPGNPEHALAEIPPGATILPPPPSNLEEMRKWATARVRGRATEKFYFNWLAPIDWQAGVVIASGASLCPKKSDANLAHAKVKYDPGPGEPRGSTSVAALNAAQYGIRARWFVVKLA